MDGRPPPVSVDPPPWQTGPSCWGAQRSTYRDEPARAKQKVDENRIPHNRFAEGLKAFQLHSKQCEDLLGKRGALRLSYSLASDYSASGAFSWKGPRGEHGSRGHGGEQGGRRPPGRTREPRQHQAAVCGFPDNRRMCIIECAQLDTRVLASSVTSLVPFSVLVYESTDPTQTRQGLRVISPGWGPIGILPRVPRAAALSRGLLCVWGQSAGLGSALRARSPADTHFFGSRPRYSTVRQLGPAVQIRLASGSNAFRAIDTPSTSKSSLSC